MSTHNARKESLPQKGGQGGKTVEVDSFFQFGGPMTHKTVNDIVVVPLVVVVVLVVTACAARHELCLWATKLTTTPAPPCLASQFGQFVRIDQVIKQA